MADSTVNRAAADPRDRLTEAGLRVTRQRVAVYEAIRAGEHLGVDAIAERVRATLGTVSTQAVYDVLRVLGDADLVRRIEPAGKPALFEARVLDNHHHLVCRACGSVVDVDCAVGETPCLTAADAHGYAIDEAEVVFWGTCPDCRVRPSTKHLPRMSVEQSSGTQPAEEAAV